MAGMTEVLTATRCMLRYGNGKRSHATPLLTPHICAELPFRGANRHLCMTVACLLLYGIIALSSFALRPAHRASGTCSM